MPVANRTASEGRVRRRRRRNTPPRGDKSRTSVTRRRARRRRRRRSTRGRRPSRRWRRLARRSRGMVQVGDLVRVRARGDAPRADVPWIEARARGGVFGARGEVLGDARGMEGVRAELEDAGVRGGRLGERASLEVGTPGSSRTTRRARGRSNAKDARAAPRRATARARGARERGGHARGRGNEGVRRGVVETAAGAPLDTSSRWFPRERREILSSRRKRACPSYRYDRGENKKRPRLGRRPLDSRRLHLRVRVTTPPPPRPRVVSSPPLARALVVSRRFTPTRC